MSKQSGIYTITNNVNGKVYVGQSSWLKKRIGAHKLKLEQGVHNNEHLQRAYDKYGKNAFSFDIVELCDESELDEREQYYIQQFDSFRNGYNRTVGGGGIRGFAVSDEVRQKMSESHSDVSGKNNPMYGRSWKDFCTAEEIAQHNERIREHNLRHTRKKHVVCLNTLAEYSSVCEAAKDMGQTERMVARCCRHDIDSCNTVYAGTPLVFVYKDEYDSMSESDIKAKLSVGIKSMKGDSNPNAKKIINITTGEIFETVNDGAAQYGIAPSSVSSALSGKVKSSGKTADRRKCVWVRYDSYLKMTDEQIRDMITAAENANRGASKPNAKAVKCVTTGDCFSTATEAGHAYHVDTSGIVACCKGKLRYCGKRDGTPLVWQYE